MAKKRKRKPPDRSARPEGSARAGGRPEAADRGSKADPARPSAVSVAPASPGGPNRIARKEEARRQREALRRKMARRRALRVVVAVTVVVMVAAAATVYLVVFRQTPAEAAGCGPLTLTPYYDHKPSEDRLHIGVGSNPRFKTPPPLDTYPTAPPASGPHLPPGEQLPQGVYTKPPNPWSSVHSLEHGAVIIWLAPSAKGSDVTKLGAFYRSSANNDHVIVAVYHYPSQGKAGQLPAGKQMAMVFWHHVQYCQRPSFAVAQSFVQHYRIPSSGVPPLDYPTNNGAPEPGSPLSPASPPPFKP